MIQPDSATTGAPPLSLIRDTLPSVTRTALARRDPTDPIHRIEAESLQGHGAARSASFGTGRRLARALAARDGYVLDAIPSDANGAPVLPAQLSVSFSYAGPWCSVAFSSSEHVIGLGIDLARVTRPPRDSWDGICTEAERAKLSLIDPALAVDLLFSAKEAYYKAHYQVVPGVDFEPLDYEVDIDVDSGKFTLEPALASVQRSMKVALMRGWCAAGVQISKS